MPALLAALVAGYILGSIPSGYLVARLAGVQDMRRHGSGNIGATNVLRTLGWGAGLAVLVLDIAKGSIAVLLMAVAGGGLEWRALAGLAAMVGHMWPFTLRFHGGKGVATGMGVLLALDPLAAVIAAAVFVLIVVSTRYVSLGSMLAAIPAVLVFGLRGAPLGAVAACALCAVAIIWRHRANIERLLAGRENRFSFKGKTTSPV